jgi:hypothetical protein
VLLYDVRAADIFRDESEGARTIGEEGEEAQFQAEVEGCEFTANDGV